eukprot:Awhi_evm1s14834
MKYYLNCYVYFAKDKAITVRLKEERENGTFENKIVQASSEKLSRSVPESPSQNYKNQNDHISLCGSPSQNYKNQNDHISLCGICFKYKPDNFIWRCPKGHGTTNLTKPESFPSFFLGLKRKRSPCSPSGFGE